MVFCTVSAGMMKKSVDNTIIRLKLKLQKMLGRTFLVRIYFAYILVWFWYIFNKFWEREEENLYLRRHQPS